MPIYRAERQFEASVMKFDDGVARDKRMIDYLKGRIRHKIRYVWQPGGDIFLLVIIT